MRTIQVIIIGFGILSLVLISGGFFLSSEGSTSGQNFSALGVNSSSLGVNLSSLGDDILKKTQSLSNEIGKGAQEALCKMDKKNCETDEESESNGNGDEERETNGIADVVLLSQRLKEGSGNSDNVIGQVKNIGNDTAEFVEIGLTSYDNNGDVIGTDFTFASSKTLKPNQKSSFDMISPKDNFEGMKNYDLSLKWRNSDGTDGYVDNAQVYKDGAVLNTTDVD